jgi:hypothetical protein
MTEPTWHNDGHTMTLILEQDSMHLEWCCPFREADLSAVAYDDRPHCRQDYGEDGQPQRDNPPLTFCNVEEFIYADNSAIEYADLDGKQAQPDANPFRVEYRWNWQDECYAWRPVLPAPTDAGAAS